jgi:uncharacterized protein YdeI (YjbR/CyaY-like superfamily)
MAKDLKKQMTPEVDEFLKLASKWPAELTKLRAILLEGGLTEGIKWRQPCYSYEGNNVAIIGELKDSCTLSFFKGAQFADPQQLLTKPGENTQSARVIRFTSAKEIDKVKAALKALIEEGIELEKSGAKFEFKKEPEPVPAELQEVFNKDSAFEKAFDALTPGRQRAYIMFFNAAKQSKTKTARIEQYRARIFDCKGMNDCVCGLSKKMPACDGSHKYA